jgi:hypothetical protein
MSGFLLLPSGGLRWHWRAARHFARWEPFRRRLADWIRSDWNPPRDQPLLLVGPSAGWCLPVDVVDEFPRVMAVDVDPLGLWLLRRRLRTPCSARVADGLGVDDAPPAQALRRLLDDAPDASVLFCNLWGQLIFEHGDDARARWASTLPAVLAGRTWASFFDRVSGPAPPRIDDGNERSARALDDDALVERFYARARTPLQHIALVDHGTGHLFGALPRLHLAWELGPAAHHLIEAVCVSSTANPSGEGAGQPLREC